MAMTPAELTAEVSRGVDRVNAVLSDVDDAIARAPSALPGWSRGHVMTHLANFCHAMARQADEAHAGRQVDVYAGGRPARDAAIEAGAGRSADELRQAVAAGTADLLRAWSAVGADDWSRPVRYRDGVLLDTAYCAWREVEVHAVDLDLGPVPAGWSAEFCLHLLDFLRPRTPDGVHLVLAADDADLRWEHGSGRTRTVTGQLADLTAWLAGRTPTGSIGTDLPELLPWP